MTINEENDDPVISSGSSSPIQEKYIPPSDHTNLRSYGQFAERERLSRITTARLEWVPPDASEYKALADQPGALPPPFQWTLLRRLLSRLPRRVMGFSLVGGGVMVGGIVLLFVLVHFLHVEQHLAYLVQAVASIETNFFLNRFTNWKDRNGNLLAQWIKFHSTSAVTFPLNQALFALLVGLGVNYLAVTVIGAGVAAIINYVANDRFVFHHSGRSSFSVEKGDRDPGQALTPLPQIGVVIPVRNSQRTIRMCVESVLRQRYAGLFEIFLVGNALDNDMTWQALGELARHPAIHCVQVDRPYGWTGRDANLKRYCGCKMAVAAHAEVIALLDSQVTVPPDWLLQAATLLREQQTDGVAGKSSRPSTDQTLSSLYQDHSLFSEWPTYGQGFFLSQSTIGMARGLPITNNLFITRQVWESIQERWPLQVTFSWEDFRLVWEIVCAGYTLFCTDTLCVFRHHQPKFRFAKHFAAGAGAVEFYQNSPNCPYVKKRLFRAWIVALGAALCLGLLAAICVLGQWSWLVLLGAGSVGVWLVLGCISMVKARNIWGLVFPWLDLLHIGLWITGAACAAWIQERANREALAQLLVVFR